MPVSRGPDTSERDADQFDDLMLDDKLPAIPNSALQSDDSNLFTGRYIER